MDEGVAVLGLQRLHHRVVGGVGLQHRPPRLVGPAGPPRNLSQQLIGPLAGPKVTAPQRQVRIHHAHQGEPREVVALGGGLGGDENIDLALLHLADEQARSLGIHHRVRREHRQARLREEGGRLFRHPLDPWTDRDKRVPGAAIWALVGLGHGEAGQMADQSAGIAVLHQP